MLSSRRRSLRQRCGQLVAQFRRAPKCQSNRRIKATSEPKVDIHILVIRKNLSTDRF